MVLGRSQRQRIAEESRRAYPGECCGFLLGSRRGGGARVTEVRPAPNAGEEGAGARRFRIAPELLLRAHREADARGLEVVGFYHSHPDAEARPSALDREHAWPGYSYLIVGVAAGVPRELRSWRMEALGGAFGEEAVADDGPCPEPR